MICHPQNMSQSLKQNLNPTFLRQDKDVCPLLHHQLAEHQCNPMQSQHILINWWERYVSNCSSNGHLVTEYIWGQKTICFALDLCFFLLQQTTLCNSPSPKSFAMQMQRPCSSGPPPPLPPPLRRLETEWCKYSVIVVTISIYPDDARKGFTPFQKQSMAFLVFRQSGTWWWIGHMDIKQPGVHCQ